MRAFIGLLSWRFYALSSGLLVLATVGAGVLEAQCPPDCIDTQPPYVYISPGTTTLSGSSTAVSITYDDDIDLDQTSRSIKLDGVEKKTSFSFGWTHQFWMATDTGTLGNLAAGKRTLVVSIRDSWGNLGSATAYYTVGVWITPRDGPVAA